MLTGLFFPYILLTLTGLFFPYILLMLTVILRRTVIVYAFFSFNVYTLKSTEISKVNQQLNICGYWMKYLIILEYNEHKIYYFDSNFNITITLIFLIVILTLKVLVKNLNKVKAKKKKKNL